MSRFKVEGCVLLIVVDRREPHNPRTYSTDNSDFNILIAIGQVVVDFGSAS